MYTSSSQWIYAYPEVIRRAISNFDVLQFSEIKSRS